MPATIVQTALPGVLLIEPRVFSDNRGWFIESWNAREFAALTGDAATFVQDNHSSSNQHVLRGLHYQVNKPQGKLVRAVSGRIFDVAVDLRRGSPTFGTWAGEYLSAENRRQMWVPAGFGHGFLVMSERAEVLYKTTDFWYPEHERSLLWSDPALGITWPVTAAPIVAAKDAAAPTLGQAELFQ